MKRRLAFLILLAAAASPSRACPPPETGPNPPSPDEMLRNRAAQAANIVYATVERSIPAWRRDLGAEELGMLRILHVYKGTLRAGQLIPIYGQVSQNDCMYEYDHAAAGRGHYGLLFLDRWNGSDPLVFVNFEAPGMAGNLIRLGIIRSARRTGAAR
jgi:hypothetical protein